MFWIITWWHIQSTLAQKCFELHAWVRKCHFGNFSEVWDVRDLLFSAALAQKCIIVS